MRNQWSAAVLRAHSTPNWFEPDLSQDDRGAPRSFAAAFLEGRRRKVGVFRWKGGRYHTRMAEEEARRLPD